MKKIFTLLTILLITGLVASAQNAFIKDGSSVSLKVQTDKIGIGSTPTAAKLSIFSVAGETPLGLYGYSSPYSPYINLFSATGVSIWRLYANPNYFTIGSSTDSTTALISGKIPKGWIKFNATCSMTKVLATSGTVTTFGSTTATVNHLETTDTTGIVIANKNGTKYRIHISNSGAVLVTAIP
jgi:hypothetical protein